MSTLKLTVTVLAFAFLAVSLYYGSGDVVTVSTGSVVSDIAPEQLTAEPTDIGPAGSYEEQEQFAYLPGVDIEVLDVTTDKDVYKSAEKMTVEAMVYCSDDVEGVLMKATGISGKMNLEKTVDLVTGENAVTFEYTLPRCNVCGGIKPGTHSCSVLAEYGEESSSYDTEVEIVQ